MITDNKDIFYKRLRIYDIKMKKLHIEYKDVYINSEKSNYQITNTGCLLNTKNYKIISVYPINKKNEIINNYKRISLIHNGKEYKFNLHRLVAMYFCEIPENLVNEGYTFDTLQVNHINGIKRCNAAFNLEWCTPKENTNHAYNTGLAETTIGENSHLAKISNKDADKICKLIMKGKSTKEIAVKMNVSVRTVSHIKYNECWKRVSDKYDFNKVKSSIKPYTLEDEDIHNVCKLLEEHKYSDTDISNMTGLTRRYITDIRLGKRRTNISSQYNIDKSAVEKITSDMIESVCKLLEEGKLSQRKIAKEIGISQWLVSEIYNKKKFTEISKNYNFNK